MEISFVKYSVLLGLEGGSISLQQCIYVTVQDIATIININRWCGAAGSARPRNKALTSASAKPLLRAASAAVSIAWNGAGYM